MPPSGYDLDMRQRSSHLLAAAAEAELHLLRSERKAEKRLAEAMASLASDEARLLRAQQRLERSRASVAAAEAALRQVQAQRVAGPAHGQNQD